MAKPLGHLATVTLLALGLTGSYALAQQSKAAAQDHAAQAAPQAAQEPLDLQEAIANDVLEPLQAGIQSRNLKQVLSVFDAQSVPNFPQLRDQINAMFESYTVARFRYKILQASSEGAQASMTCEIDLDPTPVDSGQVPIRRSTQMRLQLTRTQQGWRISSFSPSDFFAQ